MAREIKKIFKNVSLSEKDVLGHILQPNEQVEISRINWAVAPGDEDLIADIQSGDIVINDGINDLSSSDAIDWLKKWEIQDAKYVDLTTSTTTIPSFIGDLQGLLDVVYNSSLSYKLTYSGFNVSDVEIYKGSQIIQNRVAKISLTYSSFQVTQEQWTLYESDGTTVSKTVTISYTWNNLFELASATTVTT